jgi:hypothetical protein
MIRNYIKNLFVFHKALVSHHGNDYAGSLIALNCALKDMEKYQSRKDIWSSVNSPALCKRMRVAAACIDRVVENNYALKDFDYAFCEGGISVTKLKDLPSIKNMWKVAESQKTLDHKTIATFIEKYLARCWV